MSFIDSDVQRSIDVLLQSNVSFALYHLPHSDSCSLVMQHNLAVQELRSLSDLNGKRGFVMAPFAISDANKIVIISPDIYTNNKVQIADCLKAASVKCSSVDDSILSDINDDRESYNNAFERFMQKIGRQEVAKLVLSRRLQCKAPQSIARVFDTACSNYPRMMIYMCHTPSIGTWLGCSPEIILDGNSKLWHTVALAGTMQWTDNEEPEWSRKNTEEQNIVSDFLHQRLANMGNIVNENGPYTVRAGALVHLKTDFSFETTSGVGDILSLLHPTPAVCGLPQDVAFEFIADNEGYDRRYYSGIFGMLDTQNETHLYVNLRCAQFSGPKAVLYAGGGIMPKSVVESEWNETNQKMNTLLSIMNDNVF